MGSWKLKTEKTETVRNNAIEKIMNKINEDVKKNVL
jgi:hypothetical protein